MKSNFPIAPVALTALLALSNLTFAAQSVTAYDVRPAMTEQTLNAVGRLTARQSVDITSVVDGRVASLALEDGALVAANAPLVMLDAREQVARVAEVTASLHDSERQLEYMKQLIERGAVSQDELEVVTSEVERLQASLQAEQVILDDYTIRAPFAGTLSLNDISVGARIQAGSVITTLDDLSALNLTFELPESLLGSMQPGQNVTARSDAWPGESFVGQVDAIDSRINPDTLTFRARVELANPELKLRPGLFMQLQMPYATRQSLVVPVRSVQYEGARNFVYVIDLDSTTTRREITIGRSRSGLIEVLNGLQAGERVVDQGVQRVREGTRVSILPETSDAERINATAAGR